MKKALIFTVISILVLFLWFDQSRSFFCLSSDKCLTVWKRIGGQCFIIPGKFYGLYKPPSGYVKTTSTQSLTFYFSDSLPNILIVRNQSFSNENSGYEIKKAASDRYEFIEFNEDAKIRLYKEGHPKFSEVREEINYIDLDIKENYATNKYGQKIE